MKFDGINDRQLSLSKSTICPACSQVGSFYGRGGVLLIDDAIWNDPSEEGVRSASAPEHVAAWDDPSENVHFKARPRRKLRSTPFFLCAGMASTMGVTLTGGKSKVLDTDGRPNPGLLAAGNCTATWSASRYGYSGGLSKSATFALAARKRLPG